MNAIPPAITRPRANSSRQAIIRRSQVCLIALATSLSLPPALYAQVDVTTNRYDGGRSGVNLSERMLTSANVNVKQFGKLYSYPVDGAVYAQPLYLANVMIGGTAHNVVYIATMNDKVYAFDADNASPFPLWMRDFTNPPSVTAVPITDITVQRNIWGNVGIESTPVIDRAEDGTGTLYLVARTKETTTSGFKYVQRLHALDITMGSELPGSPVTIAASVPGTASDSTPGTNGQVITFNPRMQQQRAGLALTHDVVLISWAGHEDLPPYHGWIMGYDAASLAQVGVFAVSPDYGMGGIWQGGRAPTIDRAGNAYFATGNAVWDGTRNFGDSLLKFGVNTNGLTRENDYFTPSNEYYLNQNDDDLSGSGFTLLPESFTGVTGTELLLGGGKEGVLYLIDAARLGKKVQDDTQIIQRFRTNAGHVMGGPVFWNSPQGPLVYNWSEDDFLRAYAFSNGQIVESSLVAGPVKSPGHPGGSLTLTANGSTAGTGIVWASIPTTGDAKYYLRPGILRAFNAETLQEIWTSEQTSDRDRVGTLIKFVPPLVVNGKVYMASHDGAVHVYGLLPPQFTLSATPETQTIAPGTSGSFFITVAADAGFVGRVDLTATAPSGTTVTFNPQSITRSGVATMTIALGQGAPFDGFGVTVRGVSGAQVHTATVIVNGPAEIVLYASTAKPIVGNWRVVEHDATAAGGKRIEQPDAGAAKVPTPQANPANYFELTFNAKARTAYRLWIRGRAQNDSYLNDSVYMQFSGSVTATATPNYRIGTTDAVTVIIEDCSGCGLGGWGWADTGYGVAAPPIYFTEGAQTIRVQGREDGISIDQIVLSPVLYLNRSPGLPKNDRTILPPSPPLSRTIVKWAYSTDTPAVVTGNWGFVDDPSAAGGKRIEQPDAGLPKLLTASANPANYFDLTFTAEANTAYRLWIRGRAQKDSYLNDSVYVQFSGSVTSNGTPMYRTGTTEAVTVVIEDCSGCSLAGWGWQDNAYGTGALGPLLYFTAGPQTIRVQGREDGISIDQIVLSPDSYLTTAPGATKNDKTILNRTQ